MLTDLTVASIGEAAERLSRDRGEPSWLREKRLAAVDVFRSLSMPDPTRDEEWRRTSLAGLDLDGRPAGAVLEIEIGAPDEAAAAAGALASDLGTAVARRPDIVRESLASSAVPPGWGKFEALSAALFAGGFFLHVPRGVRLERPIEVRLGARPAPEAQGFGAFCRSVLLLERGSSAFVLLVAESPEDAIPGLYAGAVEVYLQEGAALRLGYVQRFGPDVYAFETRRAIVGRNARLAWVSAELGAKLARTATESHLGEQGGEARIATAVFGEARQHLDLAVRMVHVARHTASDMLHRAALRDSARAIYRGTIDIKHGAKGTSARQKQASLLLSDEARSDAIPSLFIDEEEVSASHGATAGRLDREQLFYFMSRGLSRKVAERLIVEGFFEPVVREFEEIAWREDLLGRIGRKIEREARAGA